MFGSVGFVKLSTNELQAFVNLVLYVMVKSSKLISFGKKRLCALVTFQQMLSFKYFYYQKFIEDNDNYLYVYSTGYLLPRMLLVATLFDYIPTYVYALENSLTSLIFEEEKVASVCFKNL